MAIPSGSGTEVLKVATKNALSGDNTEDMLSGVANHIYTIISCVLCEQADVSEIFSIHVYDGSNAIALVEGETLPAQGTFVWNDRIVLSGAQKFQVRSHNASNIDIILSYIDQDWT